MARLTTDEADSWATTRRRARLYWRWLTQESTLSDLALRLCSTPTLECGVCLEELFDVAAVHLEPCGCASGQLGGLPRRVRQLKQDSDYDLLIEPFLSILDRLVETRV